MANGHGGARPGGGKPRTQLDERRVLVLLSEGLSRKTVGERFGTTEDVIRGVVNRNKVKNESK